MKNFFLILMALFISCTAWSQEVDWAHKVLDFSSQKSNGPYSAIQVLGMPNVYPLVGTNANAWQPKGNRNEEFIKVGFLNPIIPRQIVIAETLHPGYITEVSVFDADGKEYSMVKYNQVTPLAASSRLFSIATPFINFHVFAIKVTLKPQTDVDVAIDAIGVSTSRKKIAIKPLVATAVFPGNLIPVKMGSGVNSQYKEIGPLLSPDGKTLYFSRRGDTANIGGTTDLEDIWYAEWDEQNKKWGEAKNIGAPLNNAYPNFISSISPDGNTILLGNIYLSDSTMDEGVSISHRTDTGWSMPQTIPIERGHNVNERASFFMSNSQKILVMSIEKKGNTEGDRDLYVSFLEKDSAWSKPKNLGKVINTKGTESSPFLASDDKTLYFSSDGLSGYGGSDIFMTRRLDESWENWSTPQNLGPIVNTARNEEYFSTSAAGDKFYFIAQTGDTNAVDMYTLEMPKMLKPLPVVLVKGRVLNSKTGEPVPDVSIYFENLQSGEEVGFAVSSPSKATYQIVLPSGNNYGYRAAREGFISVNNNMDLSKLNSYQEVERDLFITPIEKDQTVTFNNVFFDFDKAVLKKESFPELDRLSKVLKANNNIRIEVAGHTDNKGTIAYNDELANRRAMVVMNYLLDKSGVDKSRITLRSYGESNPVSTNATAQGRQLNRRVEFKIISTEQNIGKVEEK